MLASTLWIVEYSLSKNDFQIREIGSAIEQNLSGCMQGVERDYQFIGYFHCKESALIYIEGFNSRLAASSQVNSPFTKEKGLLYEDAVDFIKTSIKNKPHGYAKILCKEANLTYNTVIGLINKTLPFKTPEFVMEVLIALGYDVKMTRNMEMKVADGKKSDEIITYFITGKEGQGKS
jgi:hypothetical protein